MTVQDTLTTETIDTTPAQPTDTVDATIDTTPAQPTDTIDTTSDTPSISFEDAERLSQRITALEYRVSMTEAAIKQLQLSATAPTTTTDATTSAPTTDTTTTPTPEPEVPYFSYREIEAELKDLAPDIIVRSEADFRPEVNPTGRIYRLPTDAAVIPPEQLERLIVPSKEWAAFARILNLYPATVWRDPRDREGSNVDYIILLLHPEGLIFIRMRAVET